jgi:hypothetical protein
MEIMKITLSPISSNNTTSISLKGLILTIDNIDYDLSQIPEGGQAEGDLPFIGIVTREECTIQYHYDQSKAHLKQSTNQEDYIIELTDGELVSPIKWRENV